MSQGVLQTCSVKANPELGPGCCCSPREVTAIGVTMTGLSPPTSVGILKSSCLLAALHPSRAQHTLPPATACCGFPRILLLCLISIHVYLNIVLTRQLLSARLEPCTSHRHGATWQGSPQHRTCHICSFTPTWGETPTYTVDTHLGQEHHGKGVSGAGLHLSLASQCCRAGSSGSWWPYFSSSVTSGGRLSLSHSVIQTSGLLQQQFIPASGLPCCSTHPEQGTCCHQEQP